MKKDNIFLIYIQTKVVKGIVVNKITLNWFFCSLFHDKNKGVFKGPKVLNAFIVRPLCSIYFMVSNIIIKSFITENI